MVEWDIQQVEDDALGCVLEYPHICELNVYIQTRLQFMQHRHSVTHILEKETERAKEL